MRPFSLTNIPSPKPVRTSADPSLLNHHSPTFYEDLTISDTLPGAALPDSNRDLPWWGLPCTVTPRFGACLVQEDNRLYYLADRADIRGQFGDADVYHLGQAFPLLMRQPELMLTNSELNSRHRHTVTLYAKGLTYEADTLGSYNHVYLAVYPMPEMKNQLSRVAFRYGLAFSSCHFSIFISAYQENLQYENITRHTRTGGIALPVFRHYLADTAHPTVGSAL